MKHLLIYLQCDPAGPCRTIWPIVIGNTVGNCGLCGKVPETSSTEELYEQQTHELALFESWREYAKEFNEDG